MPPSVENLTVWIEVCLAAAAITTSLFPILYLFSPWFTSSLGRAFMLHMVSFALVLDITLVFHHWPPENLYIRLWANVGVFTFIAITSANLIWHLWRLNHAIRMPKEEYDNDRRQPL